MHKLTRNVSNLEKSSQCLGFIQTLLYLLADNPQPCQTDEYPINFKQGEHCKRKGLLTWFIYKA